MGAALIILPLALSRTEYNVAGFLPRSSRHGRGYRTALVD